MNNKHTKIFESSLNSKIEILDFSANSVRVYKMKDFPLKVTLIVILAKVQAISMSY